MMKAVSRRATLAICASMMLPGLTAAENYPSHSVKIVVPFPAGGSNGSSSQAKSPRATVATKPGSPGRARISR
jgi:tripartite-type tricarboxylate transporter receptor subunit TctC